jgi:hypothetical protein
MKNGPELFRDMGVMAQCFLGQTFASFFQMEVFPELDYETIMFDRRRREQLRQQVRPRSEVIVLDDDDDEKERAKVEAEGEEEVAAPLFPSIDENLFAGLENIISEEISVLMEKKEQEKAVEMNPTDVEQEKIEKMEKLMEADVKKEEEEEVKKKENDKEDEEKKKRKKKQKTEEQTVRRSSSTRSSRRLNGSAGEEKKVGTSRKFYLDPDPPKLVSRRANFKSKK